jgi:hypothetical protein
MKNILLLFLTMNPSLLSNAQNVGIVTANPMSKLHVSFGASGNITPFSPLVIEGNNNTYINLLTPNMNEGGLLFGKADNAASGGIIYNNTGTPNGLQFRVNGNVTRMVITNGGYMGIGASDPAYQLDIANRIRIRSGGNNGVSAGLWLNNNANTEAAFIGMEDDSHVGFYGLQAGWQFGMNTQTGALKINGNEGQAGEVIASNGSAPPSWRSVSGWLFNNTYQFNQTSNFVAAPCACSTNLPGMSFSDISINITTTSKLIISDFLSAKAIPCFTCGPTHVRFGVQILQNGYTFDGFFGGEAEGSPENGQSISLTTGMRVVTVTPATYTIRAYVVNFNGPANVECSNGRVAVQVIPQ